MTILQQNTRDVDMVFVAKDESLSAAVALYASGFNKKVDTYQNPQDFLNNIHHYPKQTKMVLGQRFDNYEQKGMEIAAYLHELGFTRLYLCSLQNFSGHPIPDYLTIIVKPNIDGEIRRILMES